LNTATQK